MNQEGKGNNLNNLTEHEQGMEEMKEMRRKLIKIAEMLVLPTLEFSDFCKGVEELGEINRRLNEIVTDVPLEGVSDPDERWKITMGYSRNILPEEEGGRL